MVEIMELSMSEVEKLLDEIDGYNENPKYVRSEFEKSFKFASPNEKLTFHGLFENGICISLTCITENSLAGVSWVSNVVAFKPGKDVGKKLIEYVSGKYEDICLCAIRTVVKNW